jgi:hypothetical protein
MASLTKPCNRFSKRLTLTKQFIAHLPTCPECKALVEQLNREPERDRLPIWSRN